MEKNQPSEVWLVSLEQTLASGKEGKYSKQKLFDYSTDGSAIMFPVGYVIQHYGETHSLKGYDGFSKMIHLHGRPIYEGTDISHLEGELLTVIDAAFTDKTQCEAIKSLVRNTIWSFNHRQEERVKEIFKAA